jgi:Flp pilus assembly protein TadG
MMRNRGLPANRSSLRKRKQRGSEMLEFTMAFLPMLMFMFLILDVAWAVYTRATLQYAVAQGLRYGVTSQTTTINGTALGQVDSIRRKVQKSAFGKLGTTNSGTAWNSIQVHFYTPAGVDCTTTEGCNKTQPLVEVSVESFSQSTFMPTIRIPGLGTMNPIIMSARAWDRMEGEPLGGAPLQGNPTP